MKRGEMPNLETCPARGPGLVKTPRPRENKTWLAAAGGCHSLNEMIVM